MFRYLVSHSSRIPSGIKLLIMCTCLYALPQINTIFHLYFVNTCRYDDTMFNRFKDPGAGATSYHMGHDFVAKFRDIEANDEVSTRGQ